VLAGPKLGPVRTCLEPGARARPGCQTVSVLLLLYHTPAYCCYTCRSRPPPLTLDTPIQAKRQEGITRTSLFTSQSKTRPASSLLLHTVAAPNLHRPFVLYLLCYSIFPQVPPLQLHHEPILEVRSYTSIRTSVLFENDPRNKSSSSTRVIQSIFNSGSPTTRCRL
jgi:hypothetical protein